MLIEPLKITQVAFFLESLEMLLVTQWERDLRNEWKALQPWVLEDWWMYARVGSILLPRPLTQEVIMGK